MKTRKTSPQDKSENNAMAVANYLVGHPAFFQQHPDVLLQIDIPHRREGSISLVERQIMLLRDQKRQSETKIDELMGIAQVNEKLAERLHRMTLSLLRVRTLDQALQTLDENLRTEFKADDVALLLFVDPASEKQHQGVFVGGEAQQRELFTDVLSAGSPHCVQMNSACQQTLFSGDAEIKSTALLPLQAQDWSGLLAIGSRDAQRYHRDMATDMLARLAEVVSSSLCRWVPANEEDG